MHIKIDKMLSVFLYLVALHSLIVGIGLIILPDFVFEFFGFNKTFDRFFSTQGGVFHIVMAVCYLRSGYDKTRFKELIVFSILVKFIAAFFLIIYYLLISPKWLIIVSGVSDFLMGIIIYLLYQKLNTETYFGKRQI